jgi:phenylpyruvate tautomerase PptA (4-oxalocrotonate tautomerase family)
MARKAGQRSHDQGGGMNPAIAFLTSRLHVQIKIKLKMPLLKIQTNQPVTPDQSPGLLRDLTDLVVNQLNKPREYVQVLLEPETVQVFAGTDQPNAFVELRSLGLPDGKPKELSRALCQLLQQHLAIAPERVFINYFDMPRTMWGWNNDTFG